MPSQREEDLEHLLRRAGFGATDSDVNAFARLGLLSFSTAVAHLVAYDTQPDDVDDQIGKIGYVGVTAQGAFSPAANINDARQRWLFRMLHSKRPLQEKMALFWHNHFATAYSKLSGNVTAAAATKMLALKEGQLPGP